MDRYRVHRDEYSEPGILEVIRKQYPEGFEVRDAVKVLDFLKTHLHRDVLEEFTHYVIDSEGVYKGIRNIIERVEEDIRNCEIYVARNKDSGKSPDEVNKFEHALKFLRLDLYQLRELLPEDED